MKLIECVPLLIVYDFVHNNFHFGKRYFFWFFLFIFIFIYSAGLIIRDFNIVSMYFHVFFAKVSCNRYSLNNFMLRVLLNVQLLHRHLQNNIFDEHFLNCHSLATSRGMVKKQQK